MCKTLKGIAVLFLMAFLHANVIHADETDATTSSDVATQDLAATPRAMSGTGTADDPFLVSTIADFKTALVADIPSINIKLTADILYSYTDVPMRITKDTVIDGADPINGTNHAMLYTSDMGFDAAHLATGAANLNITIKNVKYGNETYPNGTNYGILQVIHTNTNLTAENIDYNIQDGGQPFYANVLSTTLTLKGKNNFKAVTSSNKSGEFIEGFTTINFSDDSQTNVYLDTNQALATFLGPAGQEITIGKNALLDISSSKPYLSYTGNTNINVEENGQFNYKAIYGDNSLRPNISLKASNTLTMNFAEGSIGHFTTARIPFDSPNVTINATSPNYILFDSSSPDTPVFNTLVPTFVRKDTDGENYPINYLTKSGQVQLMPNVTGTQTVSNANIQSGYSVVYARTSKIAELKATPETGNDISKITAQVISSPEATGGGTQVSYKFAKNKLYTQSDITSSAAQDSITNDTSVPTQIQDITTSMATDSTYEYQNLTPQTYYLYSKLEDHHIAGYTFLTPWVEQEAEIKPYISVSLPDVLTFQSSRAGAFVKNPELPNDLVVNHGNVPVNLDLKSLTVKPGSSPMVSLVSSVQGLNQLHLKLVSEYLTGTGDSVTWNPLLAGPLSGQAIRLSPYWEDDRESSLSLSGDHSVSILDGEPYVVNYDLNVVVSQTT